MLRTKEDGRPSTLQLKRIESRLPMFFWNVGQTLMLRIRMETHHFGVRSLHPEAKAR